MTEESNMKQGIGALIGMISTRRPHRAKHAESDFANRWLRPLGAKPDAFGNWIHKVGESDLLWSSHIDTVHSMSGRQRVSVSPSGLIKLARKESVSNCLGADDTAGVWIMREMILAKVPGLYIFHSGEEVGGLGSSYIATHTPELLDGIAAAIAFDRRGTKSVITHQAYGRSASDAFAESFAKATGLPFKADSGGVFTDSANYVDLVGECSNISVGYENEHSKREHLESSFLIELCAAMCSYFDPSLLDFSRKAGEHEPRAYTYAPYSLDSYAYSNRAYLSAAEREESAYNGHGGRFESRYSSLHDNESEIDLVMQLLEMNPRESARLLVEEYGFTSYGFADDLYEHGAAIPTEMLAGAGDDDAESDYVVEVTLDD